MRLFKTLLLTLLTFSTLYAEGHHITRPAPLVSELDLTYKKSSFRELTLDCLERSKSLACHRAGIKHLVIGEVDDGITLLKRACELGRGWSCTVVGDIYYDGEHINKNLMIAKEYYRKGCLRESRDGCKKYPRIHIKFVAPKKSIIEEHSRLLQ